MFDTEKLKKWSRARVLGGSIEFHDRIGSTNARVRELGRAGGADGSLVIAEKQTSGRGRLGRAWHSPPGTGLYFSILLKPRPMPARPPLITLAAGLGAAEAVERVTGRRPDVKWPNDLIMDGRKIAGILTEMEFDGETPDFLVLGLGLNVNLKTEDLPAEIANQAGSLLIATGRAWDREPLLAALLEDIEARYLDLLGGRTEAVLADYRRACGTVGANVSVRWGNKTIAGTAVDVDELGRLVVETGLGERIPVDAGEVTLSPNHSRIIRAGPPR